MPALYSFLYLHSLLLLFTPALYYFFLLLLLTPASYSCSLLLLLTSAEDIFPPPKNVIKFTTQKFENSIMLVCDPSISNPIMKGFDKPKKTFFVGGQHTFFEYIYFTRIHLRSISSCLFSFFYLSKFYIFFFFRFSFF